MRPFEFDPEKSRINRAKHGVDLGWARRLWAEGHVIIPARDVSGERRFVIIARVVGKCYSAVFTQRGEAIRIISCRRADHRLETIYEEYYEE